MYALAAANPGYTYLLPEKELTQAYYPLNQLMAVDNGAKASKLLNLNPKKTPAFILACLPNDFGLDVVYFREEKEGKATNYNLYVKQVNGIEDIDKDVEDRQILSIATTPNNKKDPRSRPRMILSDDTAYFCILGDQEAYVLKAKTYSQIYDMKTAVNVEAPCFLTRNGSLVMIEQGPKILKVRKYGNGGEEQEMEVKPNHPYYSPYKVSMELDMLFLTCLFGDSAAVKPDFITTGIETSVFNTMLFQVDVTRFSPLAPQTLTKTKGKGFPMMQLSSTFVIDQNVYYIAEQQSFVKDQVYDDVLMGRISPDDTYLQRYLDRHFVPKKGPSNSAIFLNKGIVIMRVQKDELTPAYFDADNNFAPAKTFYADDADNRYFPAPGGRRFKLTRSDNKRLVLSIGS